MVRGKCKANLCSYTDNRTQKPGIFSFTYKYPEVSALRSHYDTDVIICYMY